MTFCPKYSRRPCPRLSDLLPEVEPGAWGKKGRRGGEEAKATEEGVAVGEEEEEAGEEEGEDEGGEEVEGRAEGERAPQR